MTSPGTRPPALAERLLVFVLGGDDWAESVLGDLHEEHAPRARRSRSAALVWYWTHAVRLSAYAVLRRGRRTLERSSPPQAAHPSPGDPPMRTIGLETRHALRAILKRPAIGATVVLTLALGLGANAAIFSIVDALVLRPFTTPDVDRLTIVATTRDEDIDRRETVSPADFLDIRDQADVFERFAAYQWWDANLVGRDEPERVPGFYVTADFFPALGVQPAAGRTFLPEEETVGRHRRVVLSHGLWQRRFAGDPAVVGRSVQVDGIAHEVVGIAPAGFDFPMGAQIWAPLAFDAETAALRKSRYLTALGRLAPGRTTEDAKAQVELIVDRLAQQHPDVNRGFHGRVYTLAQGMLDTGLGPILSLWQASAIFVLLIACANVASLLLARGAERQREMAVRLAMGASRARIVRELLIESGLLALVAVPAALGLAWAGLQVLRNGMPAKLVRFVAGWEAIDIDGRLIAFTVLLAGATAVIFGVVPAWQSSRPRLAQSLKDGGRGASAGSGRVRMRRGLVIAEMALALPLLVASGLSALSVHRFLNGPQGYDPDGLLIAGIVLAEGRYPDDTTRRRFADDVAARLAATPGVTHAAVANIVPSGGNNSGRSIEIDGQPNPDPANPPVADYRAVTPDYFETLRLPVVEGRRFTTADREDAQPVAIVSQSFARRHWPGTEAIGRRFRAGTGPWVTVVGVAGDHIHDWFGRRGAPTFYRPFAQAPTGYMGLLVRSTGSQPALLGPDVRATVRSVDPVQPIFDLMPMWQLLSERTVGLRYVAGIMTAFAGVALLLAVVGVYGVMAFMVTQRTHEIGVRIALGATRRDVVRLTVGQTGRLTALGVGCGVLLSVALARLIEAGLLGVASADMRIVAGFAAVLIGAALAAGYIPARRAAATDPIVALRAE